MRFARFFLIGYFILIGGSRVASQQIAAPGRDTPVPIAVSAVLTPGIVLSVSVGNTKVNGETQP